MKRLVLLMLCALALAACAEKSEPDPGAAVPAERLRVMLDYFPNADHAGLYAADYGREGLDVKLTAPPDPAAPLKLLQAGKVDLAISYEPELLLARDKGADLVAVAALVQVPLTSVMSIASEPLTSARDLAGKRVGTSGIPYQSAYLKTILAAARVDAGTVKETNVGFNLVPAMLSGKVDATLGSFWNYEATELELQGKTPQVLRIETLGVPTYNELIFVARRKDLDEEGAARLRRFLQAVEAGHERLRADVAAGVEPLLKANPDLKPDVQRAIVQKTLPAFFPADASKPYGWMEPNDWSAYAKWMRANGLLEKDPDGAGRPYTNEFLPGEGLDPDPAGRE